MSGLQRYIFHATIEMDPGMVVLAVSHIPVNRRPPLDTRLLIFWLPLLFSGCRKHRPRVPLLVIKVNRPPRISAQLIVLCLD
jgi:hypothetical protein